MGKPTEITEESIKNRLLMALSVGKADGQDARDFEDAVNRAYAAGKFQELVGIVEKATYEERIRSANVCVRHRQGNLARIIREARV